MIYTEQHETQYVEEVVSSLYVHLQSLLCISNFLLHSFFLLYSLHSLLPPPPGNLWPSGGQASQWTEAHSCRGWNGDTSLYSKMYPTQEVSHRLSSQAMYV